MKLTWLGHSAFRIELRGAVILVDPFFTGNPQFPGDLRDATRDVTHVLLTHGHGDHTGDVLDIAKSTGAVVVGDADLVGYLARRGVERVDPMNTGGTIDLGAFRVKQHRMLTPDRRAILTP